MFNSKTDANFQHNTFPHTSPGAIFQDRMLFKTKRKSLVNLQVPWKRKCKLLSHKSSLPILPLSKKINWL